MFKSLKTDYRCSFKFLIAKSLRYSVILLFSFFLIVWYSMINVWKWYPWYTIVILMIGTFGAYQNFFVRFFKTNPKSYKLNMFLRGLGRCLDQGYPDRLWHELASAISGGARWSHQLGQRSKAGVRDSRKSWSRWGEELPRSIRKCSKLRQQPRPVGSELGDAIAPKTTGSELGGHHMCPSK